MAQYTKLVAAYVPDMALSFKVGTVDIVANRLYKQHTDNTLIVAGANEAVPLFMPLTAEKAGMPVRAVPIGFGAFVVTASGAIAAGAKLSTVAAGMVKTAVATQPIVGLAYNAAADGELLTILPPVPAAVA